MTIKVFDTFTGSNGTDIDAHTPDIDVEGGGWADNGANTVELDGAGGLKFSAQDDQCKIDAGIHDQVVTTQFNPGSVDNRITIIVRSDTGDLNRYSFNFRVGDATDTLRIVKVVSGSGTQLATKSLSLSDSDTSEHKVSVIGNAIDWTIDGVSELSLTDSSVTAGDFAGLIHNKFVDGAARFFDFEVDDGLGGILTPYYYTNLLAG